MWDTVSVPAASQDVPESSRIKTVVSGVCLHTEHAVHNVCIKYKFLLYGVHSQKSPEASLTVPAKERE